MDPHSGMQNGLASGLAIPVGSASPKGLPYSFRYIYYEDTIVLGPRVDYSFQRHGIDTSRLAEGLGLGFGGMGHQSYGMDLW